jgi:hypothetical protein
LRIILKIKVAEPKDFINAIKNQFKYTFYDISNLILREEEELCLSSSNK